MRIPDVSVCSIWRDAIGGGLCFVRASSAKERHSHSLAHTGPARSWLLKRGACALWRGQCQPAGSDAVDHAALHPLDWPHSSRESQNASRFFSDLALIEPTQRPALGRGATETAYYIGAMMKALSLAALLLLALAAAPGATAARPIDDAALLQRIKAAPLPPNFPDAYEVCEWLVCGSCVWRAAAGGEAWSLSRALWPRRRRRRRRAALYAQHKRTRARNPPPPSSRSLPPSPSCATHHHHPRARHRWSTPSRCPTSCCCSRRA